MALVEEIRQAKNAQPFRPFSLKLVDGTTVYGEASGLHLGSSRPRPREVIFYVQGEDEDYHSHWIQVGLILEMIVPSETEASPQRIEGNGN